MFNKMYSLNEFMNDIYHIIAGIFLAFIFVPKAEWFVILLVVLILALIRECIQIYYGTNQRIFHFFTDPIGFVIGALIFICFRKLYYNYKKQK